MALSQAQEWANAFGRQVNKTSFGDRFAHDLGTTAKGFVPGLLEIGKTVAHDARAPFTGDSFKLDDLGKSMASGFMEQSFIPALATGQFREAAHRFNERPFSGLLDATLAAPAYKAATFAGARLGPVSSRSRFAELGGYQPVSHFDAGQITGALDNIAANGDVSAMGSLPATMIINDTVQPTRNFFGLGSSDTLTIGDQLWARPIYRTIKPGEYGNPLSERMHSKLDAPAGSLDDDLSQNLLMPRAQNELWAKAGDIIGPALASRFPRKMSERWAKKLARYNRNKGLMSSDRIAMAEAMARSKIDPVLDEIAAEIAPNMDEVQRGEALGAALWTESFGASPDDMAGLADYFSPIREYAPATFEWADDMLDMTPAQLMDQHNIGVFPIVQDGEHIQYLNPMRHPSRDRTIRDLRSSPEWATDYAIEPVSPAIKDAWSRYVEARQSMFAHAENALADSQRFGSEWKVNRDGESVPLTMEMLNDNPDVIEYLTDPRNLRPDDYKFDASRTSRSQLEEALDIIEGARTRRDVEVASHNPVVKSLLDRWVRLKNETEGPADMTPARAATFVSRSIRSMLEGKQPGYRELMGRGAGKRAVSPEQLEMARQKFMYEGASIVKEMEDIVGKGELDDLISKHDGNIKAVVDEVKSTDAANFETLQKLKRDLVEARSQFEQLKSASYRGKARVADRLREVGDAESEMGQFVRQLMDRDEYKQYSAYKDELTKRSRETEMERLDGKLLDKDRADFNEDRQRIWSGMDRDARGKYYPMRYKRKENPELQVVEQNPTFKSSDELMEPGNPYEVFLSGQFDLDPGLHGRNLQRQSDLLNRDTLIRDIRNLAVEVDGSSKSEDARFYTREENVGKSSVANSMVKLDPDGILNKDIKTTTMTLDRLAHQLRTDGAPTEWIDNLRNQIAETEKFMTQDGRHVAIPTDAYIAFRKELATSIDALNMFEKTYRQVGDWWKFTVLHARFPSWFRNNWVGAQIMLAMSGGPTKMGGAYARTLKHMDPENHARLAEAFPEAYSLSSSLIARGIKLFRFLDDDGPLAGSREKLRGVLDKLSDSNAQYADGPARLARIQQIMDDRVAQLQRLGESRGKIIEDTPELRESMMTHPQTRDGIAQEMLRDMVDFSDLSKAERDWIVAIFPFWAWIKGAGKSLVRLEADHPERVWGMDQIADLGTRESIDDAGQAVPEFARSWWNPMGDSWLSTAGWNPYESTLDAARMGLGFVPGGMSYRQYGTENLLGNVNPVIQGSMASVLGKDPFFGTPIENDNPMDTFLKMQLRNPLIKQPQQIGQALGIFDPVVSPTSTTNKTPSITLANLLGIPVLDPRWGNVWARGIDEAQENYQNKAAMFQLNPAAQGIS